MKCRCDIQSRALSIMPRGHLIFPSPLSVVRSPFIFHFLSEECRTSGQIVSRTCSKRTAYFMHEQVWQAQQASSTASESKREWGSFLQTRKDMSVRTSFLFCFFTRHSRDCCLLGPVSCSILHLDLLPPPWLFARQQNYLLRLGKTLSVLPEAQWSRSTTSKHPV